MARWEWQKKVWQPYFAPHFAQSAPYGREKCGKKSLPYFFFLFVARNGCHSFATKEEREKKLHQKYSNKEFHILVILSHRTVVHPI